MFSISKSNAIKKGIFVYEYSNLFNVYMGVFLSLEGYVLAITLARSMVIDLMPNGHCQLILIFKLGLQNFNQTLHVSSFFPFGFEDPQKSKSTPVACSSRQFLKSRPSGQFLHHK